MTDESEDEDEVVKKKKVSKATKKKAPKKTQKETKKKVSKKIVKKKTPPQKKKTLTVKGNIKTAKEASKNVQVGSFLKTPVNIPPSCSPSCFSRYPKVALTRIPCQTREDQLNCLDPRSEISRSRKRNIKQAQMFPDPVPPQTFIKNFHGSVHINCNYTKIFTNQFDPWPNNT